MKKLFLIAVTGLFFAANSNGQLQREKPQHRHMQSDSSHHFQKGKMVQQLNLTEDQKSQMKVLRQDLKQQRDAIQNDASFSADQKKEKMKELHLAQTKKMNAILTPDQQAKMKSFRQQAKANSGMHRPSHKPNQKMEQLNLTANQKTQMKALHESMRQQSAAIQNNSSLSADQKKGKMKELHQAQMKKVNGILTPDQQAKMKAFREQRKQDHKMHKMDNKPAQSEQS